MRLLLASSSFPPFHSFECCRRRSFSELVPRERVQAAPSRLAISTSRSSFGLRFRSRSRSLVGKCAERLAQSFPAGQFCANSWAGSGRVSTWRHNRNYRSCDQTTSGKWMRDASRLETGEAPNNNNNNRGSWWSNNNIAELAVVATRRERERERENNNWTPTCHIICGFILVFRTRLLGLPSELSKPHKSQNRRATRIEREKRREREREQHDNWQQEATSGLAPVSEVRQKWRKKREKFGESWSELGPTRGG